MIRNFLATHIRRFKANRVGATAVEYAILAALIAGAIIVATRAVGSALANTFNNIATNISF